MKHTIEIKYHNKSVEFEVEGKNNYAYYPTEEYFFKCQELADTIHDPESEYDALRDVDGDDVAKTGEITLDGDRINIRIGNEYVEFGPIREHDSGKDRGFSPFEFDFDLQDRLDPVLLICKLSRQIRIQTEDGSLLSHYTGEVKEVREAISEHLWDSIVETENHILPPVGAKSLIIDHPLVRAWIEDRADMLTQQIIAAGLPKEDK